ncbi:uncharacterized protein LOC122152567 [Tyto alba]|uniref:uncharacterized protein LOC122152567 n=1 Tax=Tyto alba TaxID=56313 RepID=UPI001C67CD5C|nr:uncharacterized protein LOC122152567 [Tyto alba]
MTCAKGASGPGAVWTSIKASLRAGSLIHFSCLLLLAEQGVRPSRSHVLLRSVPSLWPNPACQQLQRALRQAVPGLPRGDSSPLPVVVTLPGPILSSFPQNTAVGSTTSAACWQHPECRMVCPSTPGALASLALVAASVAGGACPARADLDVQRARRPASPKPGAGLRTELLARVSRGTEPPRALQQSREGSQVPARAVWKHGQLRSSASPAFLSAS